MRIEELKKILLSNGIKFAKHGSKHDEYINPKTGKTFRLSRNKKEISKHLANEIMKQAGIK